jgi:type IV pilus assembly protein PilB
MAQPNTAPMSDDFLSTPRGSAAPSAPQNAALENDASAPALPAADAFAPAPAESLMPATIEEEARVKRPMRIGEQLINLGLISKDQLEIALQEQKANKKLIGTILVEMGFITESALGEVLAESAGTEKFDARSTMLDPALIKAVPKEVAMRNKAIPVGYNETGAVQIAMADIYNVIAIDQIRRHLPRGVKISPVFCTEQEVLELIDQYYHYELSIDGILREIETGIRDKKALSGQEEGYVNPTVRLVNALLIDAIKTGTSDIHFEPEGSFLRLRYRIDGQMTQIRSFHRDYWQAMLVRLKIMAGMNIAETRNPQDGRISFQVMGREVDFRVAAQPTVYGENVVMRLLDKRKSLVALEKLGFSEHNMKQLKRLLKRPEGIIIVTGPTGSGKTTTLYSVLNYINSIDVNIMTLEDPVEYQLPLIRQTNVREGSVDFSSGIKSLMRQDPDIIFVGEVRDEETALMAVRAALTGHQVFTTLHTNDAMGSIPRLNDIGVPAHLLAGSLICAIAQRLARKLCDKCKKPRQATAEECRILGYPLDTPPTIYDPHGCQNCNHKGYKGRTAIIEILRVDKGMDELIATHATRSQILEHALDNGFIPMVMDGIDKVVNGEIDLQELIGTIDMTDRL